MILHLVSASRDRFATRTAPFATAPSASPPRKGSSGPLWGRASVLRDRGGGGGNRRSGQSAIPPSPRDQPREEVTEKPTNHLIGYERSDEEVKRPVARYSTRLPRTAQPRAAEATEARPA